MTTTRTPYTTGQNIEVQVTDFATPGMPRIWVAATVVEVRPMGKVFDVVYDRHDKTNVNGAQLRQATVVGARGGNKTIRAAAA